MLGFADFCSTDRARRKAAPLESTSMDVLSLDMDFSLALLNRHVKCFWGLTLGFDLSFFMFWRRNTKLFTDGAISFAVINFCSLYHKFREVSFVYD